MFHKKYDENYDIAALISKEYYYIIYIKLIFFYKS